MYSGFFIGWSGGSVLGQLDDAACDTLELADILTALSDDATDLQDETKHALVILKTCLVFMSLPVNLARGSRQSTAHRRYR